METQLKKSPRASVAHAIRDLGIRNECLLVAVSGGIDSTVLLHILKSLDSEFGLQLAVGHVDHGLRGAESDRDRDWVDQLADSLGLPCLSEEVTPESRIEGHPSRSRPTLQEAARALRYDALRAMAGRVGARRIATAHNLDDQLETVLMRLFRGCATDALGGIPERSPDGSVVRPLLAVSRALIREYARACGLQWREDSSNAADTYTRNRLRHRFIPELAKEFNPQLARAVGQLAEAHRRDREWIDSLVENEAERIFSPREGGGLSIENQGWVDLPEALARRLVQHAFRRLGAGRDLSRLHLDRMLRFLRAGPSALGGRQLELPGGLRLIRRRNCLILHRNEEKKQTTC